MTYWPISSPSVFAATKRTDLGRPHVSNDGLERKQSGDQRAGPNNGTESQLKEEHAANNASGAEEKEGSELSREAARSQPVEDDIHGTIIAVRVTRSGHLFATLTRTTLTVWQTKVPCARLFGRHLLTCSIAYCCFGFCITLRTIYQNIWPQYRCTYSPRFSNIRRTNHARLPDHVLPCDRSFFACLQDPIHKHTWRTHETKQCNHWLQDTTAT
jgi:hypothetical protein